MLLCAGAFQTGFNIMTKKIAHTDPKIVLSSYMLMLCMGSIALSSMQPITLPVLELGSDALIAGVIAAGIFGQLCIMSAAQHVRVFDIGMLSMSEIPFVYILDVLFTREVVSYVSISGACLVLFPCGSLIVNLTSRDQVLF